MSNETTTTLITVEMALKKFSEHAGKGWHVRGIIAAGHTNQHVPVLDVGFCSLDDFIVELRKRCPVEPLAWEMQSLKGWQINPQQRLIAFH